MQKNTKWTEEMQLISDVFEKLPFQKTVKWGVDVFTYQGKNVVSYGGFKDFFAIWFYNGVFLSDPDNVLTNASEGKTKFLRQWRFKSKEELNEKKIIQYLEEAIEIEKKGLKIESSPFSQEPLPEILIKEFENNLGLNLSFEKLTPGRQKEYIIYLNEAKQESTRKTRLEKIKPLIINGIGLNDKYKK
jgi:uncharacterized protein YdeI (YjbR/CyaY-like superfamily)